MHTWIDINTRIWYTRMCKCLQLCIHRAARMCSDAHIHTFIHNPFIQACTYKCIHASDKHAYTYTHVLWDHTCRAFKNSWITLIHRCLSGCCAPSESRCWGFQRRVCPFSLAASSWNVLLCTNLIVFDVSPQGFKGKTGHAGFPGQKVSQQLVALPSYYHWLLSVFRFYSCCLVCLSRLLFESTALIGKRCISSFLTLHNPF